MSWFDLTQMVDEQIHEHLGSAGTYYPNAGAGAAVENLPVKWMSPYEQADIGTPGMAAARPSIMVLLKDLPVAPVERDRVDLEVPLNGALETLTFRVSQIQKTGEGSAVLYLQRQKA